MDQARLDLALRRAVSYLARQQRPDGGFDSFSSAVQTPFNPQHRYQTTFVPALILSCLSEVPSAPSRRIRARLAAFLLKQKSPHWSFNYWAVASPERRTHPYPDDLDDTFCTLSALAAHDARLMSEAVLAASVKLLVATEAVVGGPYRTWLVPPDSEAVWLDTDLAVNANVAYFLSLVSQPLPNLQAFMEKAIKTKRLTSPYYPSPEPLVYFLARAYQGPLLPRLRLIIKERLRTAREPLQVAMLLAAARRTGINTGWQRPLERLLQTQARDGSWPPAAFCLDPAREGQTYYQGAAVLTTAFAVEALERSRRPATSAVAAAAPPSSRPESSVLKIAAKEYAGLAAELKSESLAALKRIVEGSNGREIVGLSAAFNASLAKPLTKADHLLERLSLANLYGWLAYTVYDDFLDDEGNPRLLPVANVAHRKSLQAFSEALPENTAFQAAVRQVFDIIDGANAWELMHCRAVSSKGFLHIGSLPQYGGRLKLAERSLGHALPPLAVLTAAGYGVDSLPSRAIRQALTHYLIARQLNDDAHDWQEDVSRGHITFVVGHILRAVQPAPGSYRLAELLPRMQEQFWHQSLPDICRIMTSHVHRSRRALRQSGVLRPDNAMARLLDELEASIRETMQTHASSESFLRAYRQAA